jgi:hypothetical protein
MTSVIIVSNLIQAVMAKNNDKCITTKNYDKTSSSTICVSGAHEDSIKDLKKVCKVYTNSIQCSSSQKGNGISGNFNITQTQINSP